MVSLHIHPIALVRAPGTPYATRIYGIKGLAKVTKTKIAGRLLILTFMMHLSSRICATVDLLSLKHTDSCNIFSFQFVKQHVNEDIFTTVRSKLIPL